VLLLSEFKPSFLSGAVQLLQAVIGTPASFYCDSLALEVSLWGSCTWLPSL